MFRDSIIAAIRTGVAVVVTYLITWLLGFGVTLDPDVQLSLNVALFGLLVAAYNFVVGFLERKVNPYFGVLLGVPKAPAYGTVGTTTPGGSDPEAVQQALDYVSPEKPNVTTPPAPNAAATPGV